jgi:acylphosphatase
LPPEYAAELTLRVRVRRMGSVTKRYVVRGNVQGVGYRYFAQRCATSLGVTGTVRNLDDGNVEVIAQGNKEQLDALAGFLHRGPNFSHVSGVSEMEHGPIKARDFSIRY